MQHEILPPGPLLTDAGLLAVRGRVRCCDEGSAEKVVNRW